MSLTAYGPSPPNFPSPQGGRDRVLLFNLQRSFPWFTDFLILSYGDRHLTGFVSASPPSRSLFRELDSFGLYQRDCSYAFIVH